MATENKIQHLEFHDIKNYLRLKHTHDSSLKGTMRLNLILEELQGSWL